MSSYIHPSIPSDYDMEDAFSSTNAPNYIPTPPGYSLVTPGNIPPDSLDNLTKDLLSSLSISPFHDNPYMKVVQAYDAIPLPQVIIALLAIMPPKRTSTSAAPAMTQAAIKKLVADSIAAALEAQAATMANTNRNTGTIGTPVARKGTNNHKLGDCLVFSKEVVNDNFGESRVVHLVLLFVTSVVNLISVVMWQSSPRADMKDVSEDFQIEVEFLFFIHSEPVGIFILMDRIPKLVHVNFRNICSGKKCGIAQSESNGI
ncbi:hypothetical protein Tco_0758197 [Tanacetum coccineum]